MSDTLSGKNNKVKVMYVRSEHDDAPSLKRKKNRKATDNSPRAQRHNSHDIADVSHLNEKCTYSVWQTKSQIISEAEYQLNHSDKARIDPEQLRRQRSEESRVYGENACQALFKMRCEAIVKAYFTKEMTSLFRETLRWLAAQRKAYHVIDACDMQKVSGTEHHGGVCFIIKKRKSISVADYLASSNKTKDCIIAIEEVGNPHNLGGMMRTAAHYGIAGIMTTDPDMLEAGAAIRTAEGGAEYLQAIHFGHLDQALTELQQAGYTIVTTSSHQKNRLSETALPSKTVFVLGQESKGLSDNVLAKGDIKIAIDGTGQVESLNVSVATGILLAEWWRQNH